MRLKVRYLSLPFSSEISAPALALVLGWSGRPWVASLDKFLREVCGRSSQLAAAAAAPAWCRGRDGPGEASAGGGARSAAKNTGQGRAGLLAGPGGQLANIKQHRNLETQPNLKMLFFPAYIY